MTQPTPVTPVAVQPIRHAVQYTGDNAQAIGNWLGLELAYTWEGGGQAYWLVKDQEVIGVNPGDWILASTSTPPRYPEVVAESAFTGRYIEYTPPAA